MKLPKGSFFIYKTCKNLIFANEKFKVRNWTLNIEL
ncbi:hypothetical protein C8D70_11813 [Chryseobacterium sp. CBTAP 102]|nr:hypothetical protein C8D70_11813 [Chryseobacterium sp. CBTAP 102]